MPIHSSNRLLLTLVIALYLLVGGLYAVYTPPWQAPDEPAHYNYVQHVADNGSFPVLHPGDYPHAYLEQIKSAQFPPDMSVDSIRYEFWQPPLYYALATPIYRLFGGALLPLRLVSVVLGAGVVAAAYAIALIVSPGDKGLALGTAAFVAFVPMHLTMVASVNNDALAELLLAVVMLRLMRLARAIDGKRETRSHLYYLGITGLLLGLGLVTKGTVYVAIPLALIALVLTDPGLVSLAWRALAVFVPALAIATPWYIRNVAIYGWPDLLGLRNHDAVVVGQLRTADYLADVGRVTYVKNFVTTSLHSFWGQFGWMAVPMDRRAYLAVGLLSALALVGLVLSTGLRRTGRAVQRGRSGWILATWPMSLLGLWLISTGLIYLYYNLSLVQFQGRYLFPALVPIGLLATLGLREILSRRWTWVAASVCGVIAVAVGAGSVLGGGLDKWGLLISGGLAIALFVRRWLPARLDAWVLAVPFAGMASLSVYSLFAFIIPYLTP